MVMLFASLRSMMENGLLFTFLGLMVLSWKLQKFAAKNPEAAMKGARVAGGLFLRFLKW
jgi:hypothetical protein